MSSGPGSSGKPWPRLIALLSRASCDIASKIVTGRSPKTLFMEVMGRSAAGLRRQSRGLPGQHAARKVLVVGQVRGLSGQRRRYRSLPGAAGKNHLLAMGIRNILRVETRKRPDHRARIGFDSNLVRFTDVDEKIASVGHSLGYIFRRQIVNLMTLIRHSKSSQRSAEHLTCAYSVRKTGVHSCGIRANTSKFSKPDTDCSPFG